MANNISSTKSRYYDTPIKDFYLDLWVPRKILPNITDELIVIAPKYDQRPDLLSYDLYGTEELWWVFAVRNMDELIDPIYDFIAGKSIYAPTIESLEGII
ncbi:hypothetical protein MIJ3_00396 [Pseudomonas phage vB_PaeM_MIJ3]|nr:hypothetical protein MIJ3_00396 [Pseudomonas phage vB_PaeM_MIJ3]